MVIASEAATEREGAQPLARIVAYAQADVAPEWLFEAPITGVRRLIEKVGGTIDEFDLIEINEAFAAQTLADGRELGFDWDRVNVNGGAIALGHPIGASGARIVATLLHELARREGDWLIEPMRRPPHMIIVGAIHIAIPLHRLAKLMGYRVTIVDARSKFATKERFPEADELIVSWPDEAMSKLTLDSSTYVVILTHDPKFDLPALRSVLGKEVGYIGAIGSRKTNQNRFDALRSEGFTDERLSRVHGPIGLDLGGRGAEETALGILAEITATRFGGTGAFMRDAKRSSVA